AGVDDEALLDRGAVELGAADAAVAGRPVHVCGVDGEASVGGDAGDELRLDARAVQIRPGDAIALAPIDVGASTPIPCGESAVMKFFWSFEPSSFERPMLPLVSAQRR